MKKITNNITLVLIVSLILISCGQKAKEEVKSNEQILQEVNTVIGIGKVIPAEGWAILSAPISGIIQKIVVQEGDSVQKDELILTLDQNTSALDVQQNQAVLATLQAQNKINGNNLQREKLILTELEEKYRVSQALFHKNAETAENLAQDKNKFLQQQKTVESLQSQINADLIQLKEQELAIKKSQEELGNFEVRAPRAGIVTELTADIGQAVSNTVEIGKIVNQDSILIEAEIDELMANKVQNGQQVVFHTIGRRDSIGTGTIIYTSQILSNKSILYESVGEGEDRRVRIIKIKPNQKQNLLINSKIECEIKIK